MPLKLWEFKVTKILFELHSIFTNSTVESAVYGVLGFFFEQLPSPCKEMNFKAKITTTNEEMKSRMDQGKSGIGHSWSWSYTHK